MQIEQRDLSQLIPYSNNSRTHSKLQVKQIAASIKEFGFTNPILLDENGGIIAGHGRAQAAELLGLKQVPTITLSNLTKQQIKAYIIADNQLALNAGWNMEMLQAEIEALQADDFDISLLGFDDDFLAELFGDNQDPYADGKAGSMEANFGQPPFSVLDTRKASWLDRKRVWNSIIGDNGESREGTLGDVDGMVGSINDGVSILDPVMAELCVKWFGKRDGLAFDPFAGDTVFGFVCGSSGMGFEGIELRKEQADLNQKRCTEAGLPCVYHCDTSENIDKYIKNDSLDLVFTCPPYADLEVYSDNPLDLSTMEHDAFFKVYSKIIGSTFAKLKNNRFACIVMGEVRDKKGIYLGTIPKTIQAMEAAGYKFYNEIIIVNSAGTLPLRAGKSMRATRKVGKMHQNLLVFLKGDATKAAKELGEIELQLDFGAEDED